MTESALVDKIRRALKKRGAKTLKIHGSGYQEAGTPDIIGCYRGRFFAFEVKKSEKEQPTPLQRKRMEEWITAGGWSKWGWTIEQALELLDLIDQWIVLKL